MEFQQETNRIFYQDGSGKTMAEIDFPALREGVVEIRRTVVDKSLAGQGIAGRLVGAVVEQLRRDGRRAVPTCSYAQTWFEKHPEGRDVLAES